MRNISNCTLKNCILYEYEEYDKLIQTITDGLIEADFDFDGLWHMDTDKTNMYHTEKDNEKIVIEALSEYFDVKVISIHMDNKYHVWICYEEE